MNTNRNTIPHARRGFTLVEALFAVTFLAVLFLAVAHTSSRASDAFDEGNAEHQLYRTTHRCVDKMVQSLELASRNALVPISAFPTLGASTITFATPIGFAGGVVVWGPQTTIVREAETNDPDDGIDNDNDGVVDEGRVVWIENPGTAEERRIVLASGVADYLEGEQPNNADDNGNLLRDERGLSFEASGDVLIIRLTCLRMDESKRELRKTVQTSVRLRN